MGPYLVVNHTAFLGCAHFTTIQPAIDAAAALGLPAVVRVYPGTYPEDVTLRPGVALAGVFTGARVAWGPAAGPAQGPALLPTSRPVIEGRVTLAGEPGQYHLEGLSLMPATGIALEAESPLQGFPPDAASGLWLTVRACDALAPADADAAIALRGVLGAYLIETTVLGAPGFTSSNGLVLHDSPDLLVMDRCTISPGGVAPALRVARSEAWLTDCHVGARIQAEGPVLHGRGGILTGPGPLFVVDGTHVEWRWSQLASLGDPATDRLCVLLRPGGSGSLDLGGSIVSGGIPLVDPGVSLLTPPLLP